MNSGNNDNTVVFHRFRKSYNDLSQMSGINSSNSMNTWKVVPQKENVVDSTRDGVPLATISNQGTTEDGTDLLEGNGPPSLVKLGK